MLLDIGSSHDVLVQRSFRADTLPCPTVTDAARVVCACELVKTCSRDAETSAQQHRVGRGNVADGLQPHRIELRGCFLACTP